MNKTDVCAIIFSILFLFAVTAHSAEETQSNEWKRYATPEEAGYSSVKLNKAKDYFDTLKPDLGAFLLVYKGKILISWGDETYNYRCHSMRKSFMSALYGIHVDEGNIDMQKTILELGIDDDPSLWDSEKRAKIVHLIKARSGIYHAASAETPEMRAARPERGSHGPDEFWYYNNWDFNALGTIFIQETGKDIFEEFYERIAKPIGMEDFSVDNCQYNYELQYSIHPQYAFRMSSRDRARFGQLFLQEGRWGDKQIIPKAWVEESTRMHSQGSYRGQGYGYMWWIVEKNSAAFEILDPDGTKFPLSSEISFYYASGYRGHSIEILPDEDVVMAWSVNTDLGTQNVDLDVMDKLTLMEMILNAKEFETIDLGIVKSKINPGVLTVGGRKLKLFSKVKNLSRESSTASNVKYYLSKDKILSKSDYVLGTADLASINSGKSKNVRKKMTLPKKVKKGKYYLITVVDTDNKNFDPDRANNFAVSSSKVTVK